MVWSSKSLRLIFWHSPSLLPQFSNKFYRFRRALCFVCLFRKVSSSLVLSLRHFSLHSHSCTWSLFAPSKVMMMLHNSFILHVWLNFYWNWEWCMMIIFYGVLRPNKKDSEKRVQKLGFLWSIIPMLFAKTTYTPLFDVLEVKTNTKDQGKRCGRVWITLGCLVLGVM